MVHKSAKALTLAVAVALLLAAGGILYAAPELVTSPQKQVTATQFYSEGDFFINPRNYANMDFNKWFGLVSFDSAFMAKLGFAMKIDGLYAAAYYGGNTWNIPNHKYTEQEVDFFSTPKTMKIYDNLPEYTDMNPNNNAALLIGVADMGFRLGYRSTHWSRKLNEDFLFEETYDDPDDPTVPLTRNVYYKSFLDENGVINPEIAWGMTRNIIEGRGIKPHMYISLEFNRDYQRFERYVTSADEVTEEIGRSNNDFTLDVTAAVGGFSLISDDGFDFGVDLWYILGMTMYNNDYNYTDSDGKNKIGNGLKGLYDGNSFTEISGNSHNVLPYVYASWEGEKLALAAELELGLEFGGSKKTPLALRLADGGISHDGTGTLVKDGTDTTTTSFAFAPVLSLGMQWAIVPQKFFLNAGGSLGFGKITFNTTESVIYEQGNEKEKSAVKAIENQFDHASTSLSAGVTFNPTANLGFQASCGLDTDNVVNVFDAGKGLAVFSQILAMVKF